MKIKQYEDGLKNVDTSMIYRCRIQALSDNVHTCQLLLNVVLTESIKSGNTVTKEELGRFEITSNCNISPDGYFMDNTFVSMQQGLRRLLSKSYVLLFVYLSYMMVMRLKFQKRQLWLQKQKVSTLETIQTHIK